MIETILSTLLISENIFVRFLCCKIIELLVSIYRDINYSPFEKRIDSLIPFAISINNCMSAMAVDIQLTFVHLDEFL